MTYKLKGSALKGGPDEKLAAAACRFHEMQDRTDLLHQEVNKIHTAILAGIPEYKPLNDAYLVAIKGDDSEAFARAAEKFAPVQERAKKALDASDFPEAERRADEAWQTAWAQFEKVMGIPAHTAQGIVCKLECMFRQNPETKLTSEAHPSLERFEWNALVRDIYKLAEAS